MAKSLLEHPWSIAIDPAPPDGRIGAAGRAGVRLVVGTRPLRAALLLTTYVVTAAALGAREDRKSVV
jgi:hypothetical protein